MNRLELQNTNRPLDVLLHWHRADYLDLWPPYQRGEVWGIVRKQNLIRSLLQGVPVASLIINDRTRNTNKWGDIETKFLAVIDGKQRITAILDFLNGVIRVPGEWFDDEREMVSYDDLMSSQQRRFKNLPLAVAEGSLRSIEEETAVFELVNFGGIPQGESDLSL